MKNCSKLYIVRKKYTDKTVFVSIYLKPNCSKKKYKSINFVFVCFDALIWAVLRAIKWNLAHSCDVAVVALAIYVFCVTVMSLN